MSRPAGAASAVEQEVVRLFDQLRSRLLRYALGFGIPIEDAEEIVQEVFLALYRHLVQGKSRASLTAWVFKVAHNLSLKRRLALSRMPSNPMNAGAEVESFCVVDPSPNAADQFAYRQRQQRLRSVLDALPETDRQCFPPCRRPSVSRDFGCAHDNKIVAIIGEIYGPFVIASVPVINEAEIAYLTAGSSPKTTAA